MQDGALGFVGKTHVFKAHGGRGQIGQRGGIGAVLHLLRAVHQGEHLVQIDQVLLDFAVDHAQKIERDVNLNHEGIHHDQIAQAQTPIHHPLGGPPQHGHQPDGNDQLLPAVEQRQAGAAFEAGAMAQLLRLVS